MVSVLCTSPSGLPRSSTSVRSRVGGLRTRSISRCGGSKISLPMFWLGKRWGGVVVVLVVAAVVVVTGFLNISIQTK